MSTWTVTTFLSTRRLDPQSLEMTICTPPLILLIGMMHRLQHQANIWLSCDLLGTLCAPVSEGMCFDLWGIPLWVYVIAVTDNHQKQWKDWSSGSSPSKASYHVFPSGSLQLYERRRYLIFSTKTSVSIKNSAVTFWFRALIQRDDLMFSFYAHPNSPHNMHLLNSMRVGINFGNIVTIGTSSTTISLQPSAQTLAHGMA